MMKRILLTALFCILLLFTLFIYAACVAAGREDRMREYMYEQWKQKHTGREYPVSAETEG